MSVERQGRLARPRVLSDAGAAAGAPGSGDWHEGGPKKTSVDSMRGLSA